MAAWEELPAELPSTFCGFTETDVCAIVVAGKLPEGSPKARVLFPALAQGLSSLREPGFIWSLGVGAPVAGVSNIPSSYDSALQSARLAFYRGHGRVHFPASSRLGHLSVSPADMAILRESLRDSDCDQAVHLVQRLSQEACSAELADIDSVRNAFFDLLLAVFETAGATEGREPFEEMEKTYIWQEIHERATLADLTQLVCDNLRALFSDVAPRTKESHTVMEIQRFLRQNYASPGISLQVIADHARLSRTYVSFLFKRVTGENINDYVTRLRIARAKELLRSAGVKACEVASEVGYPDSNYFSTIFRKHVGMSPTEFRESAAPAS
jgi:two-component system response regulator YesN